MPGDTTGPFARDGRPDPLARSSNHRQNEHPCDNSENLEVVSRVWPGEPANWQVVLPLPFFVSAQRDTLPPHARQRFLEHRVHPGRRELGGHAPKRLSA